MSVRITLQQAAALASVTERHLRRLAAEGKGPPGRADDGTFAAEAVGEWLRGRHLADVGVSEDGRGFDFQAERARREHYEASLAQLELAARQRSMIRRDVAEQWWATVTSMVKTNLLGVHARIGAQFGHNEFVCLHVVPEIEVEVHRSLSDLSEAIPEFPGD